MNVTAMDEIIAQREATTRLPFTGERLTPVLSGQAQIVHLHRYLLAREWCRGKDVLDVASGEGYGTALLAQVANSALGLEIRPHAVARASRSYANANLRYIVGAPGALPNPDASFDIVVSFGELEWLTEHDPFLKETCRVLRPGGLLIISTPARDNDSPADGPTSPCHERELTGEEFGALLRADFSNVSFLSQRAIYGSVLTPTVASPAVPLDFERLGGHHIESSSGLFQPQYLIAFASESSATALPPGVDIGPGPLTRPCPLEADTHLRSALRGLSTLGAATQAGQAWLHAFDRSVTVAHERASKIETLHAELIAARGEIKGLLAASEMAETACAVLRDEVGRAVKAAAAAETAATLTHRDADKRIQVLEAELAAVENRSEILRRSTSWRLTAPLRMLVRIILRRP